MADENGGTEIVQRDEIETIEEGGRFDLARVDDPTAAIVKAEQLVGTMAEKCTGPEYIAEIQGKQYPKVDWWTTVGASLGLFPREEKIRRLDRDDEVAYEATVGVYRGQELVTRASAICSDSEPTWSGRDEYAIRSMALTRATGKAFRLGLSFLPVMAGMEPTPAEEMPKQGGGGGSWSPGAKVGFGKHSSLTWEMLAEEQPGYCEWILDNDVDKAPQEAKDWLREQLEGDGEGRENWNKPEVVRARNKLQVELLEWTNEDRVALIFRAYAKMRDNQPNDVEEWIPADYKRAIEDWREHGKERLMETEEWVDANLQGEMLEG